MDCDRPYRRYDVLALAVIVVGVTLFHARGLWPGQTFLPVDLASNNLPWRTGPPKPLQNSLISDPLYQFYPFLVSSIDSLRQGGRWPLWNSDILLGHPAVADPLAQTFYPVFSVLGLLCGPARGLAIGLWMHAILAATLSYGFLRTIRCRPWAAVLGAFTYALSGYMVTWFETTFWISTLSWLPGILWAFELAVRRRSWQYVALSAAMMALAILGGQFAFVLTFSLFLGLYAIGRTLESRWRSDRQYLWPTKAAVLVVSLGTLLSAIQLVPFAEYFINLSHRALSGGLPSSLPERQLITLIIPNFYGNPTSTVSYWGAINFSEATIYAGLPALLLACLTPFCASRFFRLYLCLVAVVIVYLLIGGPGVGILTFVPVLKYAALHRSAFLLPLLVAVLASTTLSEPKLPTRAVGITAAMLSAVVALAVHVNAGEVQAHWQELKSPILQGGVVLAATVVLLALRGRSPHVRRWADLSLVALAFIDLVLFGSRFNPAGPTEELMPLTPAIEYLEEHVGLYRTVAFQLGDVLFGPNVLSVYGIAEPGGYSSLVTARLRTLAKAGDPKVDIEWMDLNPNMIAFSHPSSRLLDLMQVAYAVSPVPLADLGVHAELASDGCDGDSGEIAGTRTISGSFTVQDTAINRLDLRFRVHTVGRASGALVIRMWQGADRSRLMLDVQQDVAELRDQENLTLYFAPEREAPGQTYVWEVAAAESEPHTGVGLCTDAHGQPAISVYGADWSLAYSGEVYIYERLLPLPRAYVVYAAEYVPDDEQTVSRLLDDSFDLRNVAIVADPVALVTNADVSASPAEIVAYQDTRVVVTASAGQRGLLLLGDQFHPGWHAYLDGEPTAIIRANHVFRGVVLPPGGHQVEFRFAPASLRTGRWLSLAGVAALIILVAFERHRGAAS